MDRAHRIGQTKPVAVYRLLTTGSVEIDMMEKQISKKKLERMAISGGNFARPGQRRDGDGSAGAFTVDVLQQLLADDVNLDERAEDAVRGGRFQSVEPPSKHQTRALAAKESQEKKGRSKETLPLRAPRAHSDKGS
jgi:hypothetical protein